jgi:hypothetical protein
MKGVSHPPPKSTSQSGSFSTSSIQEGNRSTCSIQRGGPFAPSPYEPLRALGSGCSLSCSNHAGTSLSGYSSNSINEFINADISDLNVIYIWVMQMLGDGYYRYRIYYVFVLVHSNDKLFQKCKPSSLTSDSGNASMQFIQCGAFFIVSIHAGGPSSP